MCQIFKKTTTILPYAFCFVNLFVYRLNIRDNFLSPFLLNTLHAIFFLCWKRVWNYERACTWLAFAVANNILQLYNNIHCQRILFPLKISIFDFAIKKTNSLPNRFILPKKGRCLSALRIVFIAQCYCCYLFLRV